MQQSGNSIMKYSWKLGRLCGTDVRLHWSFLIVPAWVTLTMLAAGASLMSAIVAIIFVFAVFGCVLLHELGHALMARRYGIATCDITLLPIGGLARLDGMPRSPRQEIAIALAGPAVNLVIAVAVGIGLLYGAAVQTSLAIVPTANTFLTNLAVVNLVLAAFNLVPAFPMDGGRVLRALLAMCFSHERATQIAAGVGQGLAVCLAAGVMFGHWNLLLIGIFVFAAARSEVERTKYSHALSLQAEPAIPKNPATFVLLPAHARAHDVAKVLFSQQYYFPVLHDREVVGVLSRAALLKALANARGDRLIAELMTEANCAAPHRA
jgi:Zn-dependent protease